MKKLKKNFLNIPIIETKRLVLDFPVEKDYRKIEIFLKGKRSKYIGGPYTSFTAWKDYMANIGHWALHKYGLWSVRLKQNKKFIGRVGIIKPPMFKEPDLAWQLFDGYEGKGYAKEAATAIKNYAKDNLHLKILASHILETNLRSLRLAESLDFSSKSEATILEKKFIIYNYN